MSWRTDHGRGRLALQLAATAGALLIVSAPSARAGTIDVTTTADQHGKKPRVCALREAIVAANTDADFGGCNDSGGGDAVKLRGRRYVLTRAGAGEDAATKGDLDITGDLRIRGKGAGATVIDGNGARVEDRVLQVHMPAIVKMSALTIRGAALDMDTGGGIHNRGTLTIEDSAIRDNVATGGAGGIGGAGEVTIRDSIVRDNRSGESTTAGGIGNFGGGTLRVIDSAVIANKSGAFGAGISANNSEVTVRRSTVRDNRAGGDGGGIAQLAASLEVTDSVIKDNTAKEDDAGGIYGLATSISLTDVRLAGNRAKAGSGGAIAIFASSADLSLDQTTLNGNRADDDGGGLWIQNGEATVLNSTISANEAKDNGGGIAGGETSTETETTLNNATVAGNVADSDQASGGSGGGVFRTSGSIVLYNTLLGDNLDLSLPGENDCDGAIVAAYSLIEDDCPGFGSNNVVGEDPMLKPLATNGADTKTHALKGNSPALEAADPATPGSAETACLTTDQRGEPRPSGTLCDIGAFERQ